MSTSHSAGELTRRFVALDTLLADHRWLWAPQPFKEPRPAWCEHLPSLAANLQRLSAAEIDAYSADSTGCMAVLAPHIPAVTELLSLQELPVRETLPPATMSAHLSRDVPGRKWQQIAAFARALGPVDQSITEWCGGKGHLGRYLSSQWRVPVRTVEWNDQLCTHGTELAQRAKAEQSFVCQDVQLDTARELLPHAHVVALHACGELHRHLVRRAGAAQITALDIAPCCYANGVEDHYVSFNAQATLSLRRDDLRLAVTEPGTSSAAELRLRDQEMAWKLGYDNWRRSLLGADVYLPMKPIPKHWLKLSFVDFCRQLAQRDGLSLDNAINCRDFETIGWQRQQQVMALSVVRFAFRRALEVWLALDMALHLQQNDYEVTLGTFCDVSVSPRNILLSARRNA